MNRDIHTEAEEVSAQYQLEIDQGKLIAQLYDLENQNKMMMECLVLLELAARDNAAALQLWTYSTDGRKLVSFLPEDPRRGLLKNTLKALAAFDEIRAEDYNLTGE